MIRLRDDEHLVGVQRVAEQDVDDVVEDVELSAEAPAGEAPAADDADNNSQLISSDEFNALPADEQTSVVTSIPLHA